MQNITLKLIQNPEYSTEICEELLDLDKVIKVKTKQLEDLGSDRVEGFQILDELFFLAKKKRKIIEKVMLLRTVDYCIG